MSNTYNKLINIEDIESAPNKTLHAKFEDFIEGITSKEPIFATLELISLGEFIQVKGNVSGCAVLECDLCLEKYNYEFNFDVDELFAKNEVYEECGQEIEIKDGQFVTDLQGSSDIDISDFLYQSVILDFPNKKVCGINCKGGDIFIREESSTEKEPDPRLAVFKNIEVKNK